MKYYEVLLRIMLGTRVIGRQSVSLRARSPFRAAIEAESMLETAFGQEAYCIAFKVTRITKDEYSMLAVA